MAAIKHYALGGATKKMPAVGLGTWQSKPGEVRKAVAAAIKCGYRHIDCAYIYGNEAEVGQGIADAGIPRDELWITSKLWNSWHQPQHVPKNIDETLKNLGVDYLDLYLMHWPVAFKVPSEGAPPAVPKDDKGTVLIDEALTEDPLPTWQAMEKLVEAGKTKHIGISNFNIRRTKKLLGGAKIKPAVNQVELNFTNPQPELLKWSKEQGILIESYSPLGSTGAAHREEDAVVELAKKYDCDAANILISWQIARGAVCLPKSVTPSRIENNFKIIDLSSEDVQTLEKAAASKPPQRVVLPQWGVDIFEDDKEAKL